MQQTLQGNCCRLSLCHAGVSMQGHTATVEDVGFKPRSSVELVSVGDDHALLVWDTRGGNKAVLRMDKAHGDNDLHCVDWNGKDTHYLATGGVRVLHAQSCIPQHVCIYRLAMQSLFWTWDH